MRTKWHKRVLEENKKEIIKSTAISLTVTFGFTIWHFLTGKAFQWVEISPIDVPSIPSRLFYSVLVFLTIGAFLYFIRFYQLLHFLIVRQMNDKKAYREAKGVIWISLMALMYFWIVPKFVDLLNKIISFLYNIIVFSIFYIFPPVGIFFLSFSVCGAVFWIKKRQIKKEITTPSATPPTSSIP